MKPQVHDQLAKLSEEHLEKVMQNREQAFKPIWIPIFADVVLIKTLWTLLKK